MLNLNSTQNIYLAVEPVDIAKQFNGLQAMAAEGLSKNLFDGAMFCFTNKRKDRLKYYFGMGQEFGFWLSDLRRVSLCT